MLAKHGFILVWAVIIAIVLFVVFAGRGESQPLSNAALTERVMLLSNENAKLFKTVDALENRLRHLEDETTDYLREDIEMNKGR